MSEIAIRAVDLTKVYRLYRKPSYKFWDAMGWLPKGGSRYSEHPALNGVSFDIMKGEKVGIIGRNGAGKSTLLKLVTRAIEPTSGQLIVNGETQALLQIGTGFHPDLTGRDNVISYLAQLGISGKKAADLIQDIIEFAELEEYIDQPVKSYSTGMGARLMFAASTVIEPSLLVIDEILGVGDAYFARKSFERIRELCDRNDATLLLVSHDIYSSAQICNRIIWVDRGTIRFDGAPKDAINLYEASIKEQEERRLRRKALIKAPRMQIESERRQVIVEIRPAKGTALSSSIFFYDIALRLSGRQTSIDPESGKADAGKAGASLVSEGSNWLTPEEVGRSDGTILANYGSAFHKGTIRIWWDKGQSAPELCLDMEASGDQKLQIIIYDEKDAAFTGESISLERGQRQSALQSLNTASLPVADINVSSTDNVSYGTGSLRIVDLDLKDEANNSIRNAHLGGKLYFNIAYNIIDVSLDKAEAMITIRKDKVINVMNIFCEEIDLKGRKKVGLMQVEVEDFPLTKGKYTVTVLIAKSGYYKGSTGTFFSTSDDVYDVARDAIEFAVSTDDPAFNNTIVGLRGDWRFLEQ